MNLLNDPGNYYHLNLAGAKTIDETKVFEAGKKANFFILIISGQTIYVHNSNMEIKYNYEYYGAEALKFAEEDFIPDFSVCANSNLIYFKLRVD